MKHIIHHNIFTFKSRSINDNYLLYFNFFLNCYDIHLLLITLVDTFHWCPGLFLGRVILKKPMVNVFCSFFSSSISSSFTNTSLKKHGQKTHKSFDKNWSKKKKNLNFPNNGGSSWLIAPLPRTFKLPQAHTIIKKLSKCNDNLLVLTCCNFLIHKQLATRTIAKYDVSINQSCSIYLKV